MESVLEVPDGFGETTVAELAELRKALEIGYTQPPTTSGDSLRVESLESTLKLITFQAQHAKLWNQIQKIDAYSTIEEYNRLTAYGSDQGGFVASGVLPEEDDSTYERASQKVKYIGTTRAVHHPATLVRTVPADLIAQETQNGTLWVIGKANQAMYFGNEDAIPLEWNGLIKQAIDGGCTVKDMAGAALAATDLEDAARIIADNYGIPSAMYSGQKPFSDFGATYGQYQRFAAPNVQPGVVGTPVTGYKSMAGVVDFNPDVFIRPGGTYLASASSPKAPNAPTAASNAATGTDSLFVAADAGNYYWKVSAINQYGESAPSAATTVQAVTATTHVVIDITDGGGAFPATAYKVYRSDKGGAATTCKYIGYLAPRTKSVGVYQATTAWTDLCYYRPDTVWGIMLDMTIQVVAFKQLAPMMKMNLATISPAIRWMQLLYGTPILYQPKKVVVFRNIKGS